jgi:nuclear transport factor 2 (NTF2) superfamily protein
VRVAHEWREAAGQRFRRYGNENRASDAEGLISNSLMCLEIGGLAARESEFQRPKAIAVWASGKSSGREPPCTARHEDGLG